MPGKQFTALVNRIYHATICLTITLLTLQLPQHQPNQAVRYLNYILFVNAWRKVTKVGYLDNSCWQNYVDYYKCVNARGEEFEPCKQFYRAFHSLCPNGWVGS